MGVWRVGKGAFDHLAFGNILQHFLTITFFTKNGSEIRLDALNKLKIH